MKCPGCDRIYRASRDEHHDASVEVRDELDVLLMTAAYSNKAKRISKAKAQKLISKTKWQYPEDPTSNLTEAELMEWTDDGDYLCLTEAGQDDYETFIQAAEETSE